MFTTADKKATSTANHRQEGMDAVFFRKAGGDNLFTEQQQYSFFSPSVQAKLSVSHPDDPQEKEADALAEHVMRMPEPLYE